MNLNRSAREKRNIEVAEFLVVNSSIKAFLDRLSDDYVWEGAPLFPYPGKLVGKKEVTAGVIKLREIFPDMQQQQVSILADNDKLCQVTRNFGEKTNGFMGLPPIHRSWEFTAVGLFTFAEDGLISRQKFFWDRGSVLLQLGVIPPVGLFGPAPGNSADWAPCLGKPGADQEQVLNPSSIFDGFRGMGSLIMSPLHFPFGLFSNGLRAISSELVRLRSVFGPRGLSREGLMPAPPQRPFVLPREEHVQQSTSFK